jgi:hypothetical protein
MGDDVAMATSPVMEQQQSQHRILMLLLNKVFDSPADTAQLQRAHRLGTLS